jgi:Calpain family cysteine protease
MRLALGVIPIALRASEDHKSSEQQRADQQYPDQQRINQQRPDQLGDDINHPFKAVDVASDAKNFGVNQSSSHGDCWFEAALTGLAQSPKGPETIASMITKDGEGYIVTFPGDKKNPVHVNQSEIDADKLSDKAVWARVIETAIIKTATAHAEGGTQNHAIELLTGKDSVTFANAAFSQETLGRQLEEALKKGEVVETASRDRSSVFAKNPEASTRELVDGHAYSVLKYDANGPDGGTVIVRNPWGMNQGTAVEKEGSTSDGVTNIGDGQLKMSLATFKEKFDNVTVEQDDTSVNSKARDVATTVFSTTVIVGVGFRDKAVATFS